MLKKENYNKEEEEGEGGLLGLKKRGFSKIDT